MARAIVTAIVVAAAALGCGGASAQSYEQYQNRLQLQDSQRQLDNNSYRRDSEARQQDRNIQNRIERLDTDTRLNSPPILRQPPIVSPNR